MIGLEFFTVGRNLIQLSWTSGRAIVWDMITLAAVSDFQYEGQGWGLCNDGDRLIMSDPSESQSTRLIAFMNSFR